MRDMKTCQGYAPNTISSSSFYKRFGATHLFILFDLQGQSPDMFVENTNNKILSIVDATRL